MIPEVSPNLIFIFLIHANGKGSFFYSYYATFLLILNLGSETDGLILHQ